jgi:hypothetical protein
LKFTWTDIKESIIVQLAYRLILFVCRTLRPSRTDIESMNRCRSRGENAIYVFWHRRLFYMGYLRLKHFSSMKVWILVSQSRDGTRIGKVVEKMGIPYIQGSSTRGGAAAFMNLVRMLKAGDSVAITPDGPRGPRGLVQKGVISLARMTGRPIIPVSYNVSRCFELTSWDRFVIPVPFAKVSIASGEPVAITPGDNRDDAFYEALLKERLDQLESIPV